MSTETVENHVVVERLNREIFGSILPHDPENDDKRYHSARRSDIPKELLVQPVNVTADVKVDDILVLVEGDAYGNSLVTYTAYDAIMYGGNRVEFAVVVKTTSKQIVVRYVGKPWSNWRTNLAEFGKSLTAVDQRLSINSLSRQIGRLGTMQELRQKLAAHPKFAEWQAAYAAAHEEADARDAAARAEREAREQRQGPIKAAVQGLADITGERLVTMAFTDTPRGENPWLEANDFMRTRVYLAGLHAVGQLTGAQHRQALTHLAVIIAAAKEKK